MYFSFYSLSFLFDSQAREADEIIVFIVRNRRIVSFCFSVHFVPYQEDIDTSFAHQWDRRKRRGRKEVMRRGREVRKWERIWWENETKRGKRKERDDVIVFRGVRWVDEVRFDSRERCSHLFFPNLILSLLWTPCVRTDGTLSPIWRNVCSSFAHFFSILLSLLVHFKLTIVSSPLCFLITNYRWWRSSNLNVLQAWGKQL